MAIRKLIQHNRLFLSFFLVFLILGIIYNFGISDKGSTHLLLNSFHSSTLDVIMKYYTVVGEWIPYVVVALLLFYKLGWSLFLLADVALSGLVTQVLKHLFDASRPYSWFATYYPEVELPLVDGVRLSQYFSFPSGHSTTFFAMFFALSIVCTEHIASYSIQSTKNKTISYILQTIFISLAILGGYSRIYLSQHFLEDILGGAFVGIFTTLCLYCTIQNLKNKSFWHYNLKKSKKIL
jgi:membrane-associated phospholipid phosphatase